MEKSSKQLNDISEIRQIMERSTRFLSLSGWSGIFAGLVAIAGFISVFLYLSNEGIQYSDAFLPVEGRNALSPAVFLLINAIVVLILALLSAVFFSARRAKKQGEKIWSPVTRRLLFQLAVPLISGGLLCLVFLYRGSAIFIAPLTLIFYGIALVNAGKYTNREVVWLGISEILLGLCASLWPESGIYFWTIGFGIFHLIYGITLYFKYERKVS